MKKKQYLFILVAAIVILAILDFNYILRARLNPEPKIAEMSSLARYVAVHSSYERFFVITSPPENLDELKHLVEDYVEEYIQGGSNTTEGYDVERYHFRFFRETRTLNADYKEIPGHFSNDLIEDRYDDIICTVTWDEGDSSKYYWVRQRSDKKKNYGEVISEKEFLGDERLN